MLGRGNGLENNFIMIMYNHNSKNYNSIISKYSFAAASDYLLSWVPLIYGSFDLTQYSLLVVDPQG